MSARLYFASCTAANGADMGAIKIGCSYGPEHRINAVTQQLPFDLTLLATCPGDMFQESAVHLWLRAHRIAGEFFRDAPPVLDFVAHVRRHGRIPLPIEGEESGFWLTRDEVVAFMVRRGLTVGDIAAITGARPESYEAALKKERPNRRIVAALCVAALERNWPVAWTDFRREEQEAA